MTRVDVSKVIPCRVCNGYGTRIVWLDNVGRNEVNCTTCNGTGRRQTKPNPHYVGNQGEQS